MYRTGHVARGFILGLLLGISILSFTFTCSSVKGQVFGKTDIGGTQADVPLGYAFADRLQAPEDGTATQISAYLKGRYTAGLVKALIYTDVAGETGTLLAESETTLSAQWAWHNFTVNHPLTAGTYYWVGIFTSVEARTTVDAGLPGHHAYAWGWTYPTVPTEFGGVYGPVYAAEATSLYVTYVPTTIYIRADGRIDPATANLTSADNRTYTFTGNVQDPIVVERDHIVVDGAGYVLHGPGNKTGLHITGRQNVTVTNLTITTWDRGLHLAASTHCRIVGNILLYNTYGFWLEGASNNCLAANNVINNTLQVTSVNATNLWHQGYPAGGNYWSDYTGADYYQGPAQNGTGRDGVGDTEHLLAPNTTDPYPLIKPVGNPDVGLFSLTPAKTVVGQGQPVAFNVSVVNYGVAAVTSTLTVRLNGTAVGTAVNVSVAGRTTSFITVTANTANVSFGNYTVETDAWTLGEHDDHDNTVIDGWLTVTLTGDVDGDCDVDDTDVFTYVALAYGSRRGDPKFHANSDIDGDGDVDSTDVFSYLALNYGQSCP